MNSIDSFKTCQRRLLERVGLEASSRFVDTTVVSGDTHVLVSGHGPAVVLVPGFTDPAAMWAPLMAGLDGFTLYAVDRPCFGLTGPPRHASTDPRSLAVGFLEQVLDALHLESPLFVANSIGSLWAMWFALDRPDRVTASVHIGCPAFILGTSAPLPMRLLTVPLLGRLLMRLMPPSPGQVDRFAAMVGADLSGLPELRDLLVAAQKLPGAGARTRELLRSLAGVRGPRDGVELTETQLEQLSQPVQLIWGERDPFGAPEDGARVAAAIPEADFNILPGAGHVPWVDHAVPVGELAGHYLRAHSYGENTRKSHGQDG